MSKTRIDALLNASPYSFYCPHDKITEVDFDGIYENAGGVRISEDESESADYKFEEFILELKFLEKEGLHSSIRQKKLAELFWQTQPDRPVVVLDDSLLNHTEKHKYREIFKGTIQSHIRKAKRQLSESRRKYPDTKISIVHFHNIGFASLNDSDLFELIKNRVKNDASSIDGIAVSGSYTLADGFSVEAFFNYKYEPLSDEGAKVKDVMDSIHRSYIYFQTKALQNAMRGDVVPDDEVVPLTDIVFEVNNVRYVRPAPPLSGDSGMFPQGRQRIVATESSIIGKAPKIIPRLSPEQWEHLTRNCMELEGDSHEGFSAIQRDRAKASEPLALVVQFPVDLELFHSWCVESGHSHISYDSLSTYAVSSFNFAVNEVIISRRIFDMARIRSRRYILVCTELIGQDESNDISHIFEATERGNELPDATEIITNIRTCQNQAICIGAVNAVARGIDSIYVVENRQYGWV